MFLTLKTNKQFDLSEFEITNEDDYKKNLVEKNKNNSIKNPKKEDELIDEITSE